MKANHTKSKLKTMLKNIDDSNLQAFILLIAKSGFVKEDLFYQLLSLHGVDLSSEAKNVLNSYKKRDTINYNEALTVIAID